MQVLFACIQQVMIQLELTIGDAPMEFMTLTEARERATEIRASFDMLMDTRSMTTKKNAAQWRYFRICLERTLGAQTAIPDWSPLQIAQYKFEVEDKLRRLYLRGGQALAFVFRLVSSRDACREHLVVDDDYPETGGYYLLVRNRSESPGIGSETAATRREHIEMVVAGCIDAEFDAYRALPAIDEAKLQRWFADDGPAYRDLIHTLKQMARRGWILTNPHNPSTKRLMAIKVKEILDGEAAVRTTEYWYLRWWSTIEGKYRYPYRETNRQTYILAQRGDDWLVRENIRPAPRSSTPHRQG